MVYIFRKWMRSILWPRNRIYVTYLEVFLKFDKDNCLNLIHHQNYWWQHHLANPWEASKTSQTIIWKNWILHNVPGRYVPVYTHCFSMTAFFTNENYMDTLHNTYQVLSFSISWHTSINTMIELKLSLHNRKTWKWIWNVSWNHCRNVFNLSKVIFSW